MDQMTTIKNLINDARERVNRVIEQAFDDLIDGALDSLPAAPPSGDAVAVALRGLLSVVRAAIRAGRLPLPKSEEGHTLIKAIEAADRELEGLGEAPPYREPLSEEEVERLADRLMAYVKPREEPEVRVQFDAGSLGAVALSRRDLAEHLEADRKLYLARGGVL